LNRIKTVARWDVRVLGKLILVLSIFRYFEPNQGQILIDGEDIRRLDVTIIGGFTVHCGADAFVMKISC